MNIFNTSEAKLFLEELMHKNKLLKRLNISYTKSLGYIDAKNYDMLTSELDIQNDIITEINNFNSDKYITAGDYYNVQERVASYILNCGIEDALYPIFIKIISDITLYNKLLKNCKSLNEKLVYQVNQKKIEFESQISALKSRRIIKNNYITDHSHEKGLLINCTSC